jgi:hypothetical protein
VALVQVALIRRLAAEGPLSIQWFGKRGWQAGMVWLVAMCGWLRCVARIPAVKLSQLFGHVADVCSRMPHTTITTKTAAQHATVQPLITTIFRLALSISIAIATHI